MGTIEVDIYNIIYNKDIYNIIYNKDICNIIYNKMYPYSLKSAQIGNVTKMFEHFLRNMDTFYYI